MDTCTKILLMIVALLLLVNVSQSLWPTTPAVASDAQNEIGRYQLSSWASRSGPIGHHSGYYILDTATGRVVDSKAEVHSAKE